MLVIGGGIIGLEMGTVYSTLGARLDVVEMLDGLMQGADRDLVKVWQKLNAPRFDNIMLKTKTVGAEATKDGIRVELRRRAGAARSRSSTTWCCRPSAAVPNGKKIGAEKAGVAVERPRLHPGRHPDAHQRAAHLRDRRHRRPADAGAQGGARGARGGRGDAGEQRRRELASAFDARVIPTVAYTDPEVAWVGLTEDEAKAEGVKIKKGLFPWTARAARSPTAATRASPSCCSTRTTHRIVGGGIVGTHAGDMIGEIALAIEMGADAVDIGKTIHPHPTLGESIGLAAEAFEGRLHRPAAGQALNGSEQQKTRRRRVSLFG